MDFRAKWDGVVHSELDQEKLDLAGTHSNSGIAVSGFCGCNRFNNAVMRRTRRVRVNSSIIFTDLHTATYSPTARKDASKRILSRHFPKDVWYENVVVFVSWSLRKNAIKKKLYSAVRSLLFCEKKLWNFFFTPAQDVRCTGKVFP